MELSNQVKIEQGVRLILKGIGANVESEHLEDTPKRVARMYLNELCAGYSQNPQDILKVSFTEDKYDQMIFVDGIEVISLCSHHMLPFWGEAKIGYLPNKRVVGLSKLSRIVKVFAARLQVQERLTDEVATALYDTLKPRGVGVYLQASHLCSCIRGVKNKDMKMKTVSLKGEFLKAPSLKQEFMSLCLGK